VEAIGLEQRQERALDLRDQVSRAARLRGGLRELAEG
jgi:hypothetical protein